MLGCFANVWIRQKHFPVVGKELNGHTHKYDHVSLLAKGKVKVRIGDIEKEFTAPTFIVIRKDDVHNVTALEPDTLWYCIFADRDIDGEVFDPEKNCPRDMQCSGLAPTMRSLEDISIDA